MKFLHHIFIKLYGWEKLYAVCLVCGVAIVLVHSGNDLPAMDINGFSAMAQFDFYMQVQQHYTAHNTSATIEFRENEIDALSEALYQAMQNGDGYISAALLARFDANATFPRLPFEPIDAATYESLKADVVKRRVSTDFFEALQRYDQGELTEAGPAGCDSDKCLLPLAKPGS